MTAGQIYGPIVPVSWLHADGKLRQAEGWQFGSFTVHGHASGQEVGMPSWSVNHAATGMWVWSFDDIDNAKRFCEGINLLCCWELVTGQINGRKMYGDPPEYGARIREKVYDIARRLEGDR